MVPVGLVDHPLTATAALVWNGDLPRPLQQVLFDAADAITPPARPGRQVPTRRSSNRIPGTWVAFLIYQQVENHVLNPVIMSRTANVNPLLVLLSVLVGTSIGNWVEEPVRQFCRKGPPVLQPVLALEDEVEQ